MSVLLLLAALYTDTAHVAGVAVQGEVLWAATSGGVEQYDLRLGTRTRVFTTEDGLDANEVLRVWSEGASLRARTARSECRLETQGRFLCTPAAPLPPAEPAVAPLHHRARETARIRADGREIVATDGAGLWLDGRRITPDGQLCGNHVEALASLRGALWVGTFDRGICVLERGQFRSVPVPFRMVNDLAATPEGLWVAAGEGLYFSPEGHRFLRETRVRERGANRIAVTRRWVFVTTPAALYAIRRDKAAIVRRWRRPAGSTALQAVAVSGRDVWLASEDAGVIRMRGEKFQVFDRASGLPSSWIVDVAPARGGGVWVATLRDGMLRLGPDGSVRERGRDSRAWGLRVYVDDGSVLFGTQQGIEGWTAPLPDPRVHALLRTSDGLWVGTEGGLLLADMAKL